MKDDTPPGRGTTLWNTIHVHRSYASFWYNYVFLLIAAVPALLLYSYLLPNVILPFPDAFGFESLVVNFFGLFFSVMDMATGPACERFIAQHAEINPRKALKYLQFFIWFQMTTGLVQVSGVAIFCFTSVIHSNLGYAMWFFLTYSLTQYPGMLASFNATLRGYQRYDRSNIVDLIQGALFENVTQIVFILLGRWVGSMNPALGELYGATIGFIIGRYLDDFVAMMVSGWFLGKILKPYGIRLRETVIPGFDRAIVKETLLYGAKLLGSTVISALTEWITLVMMISWLPNYIFIIGLVQLAKSIAGLVGTRFNFSSLISESYNNGKKKLAQYSITQSWSTWWVIGFFLAMEITLIIPSVFQKLGGNFAYVSVIIPIYVLPRLLVTPAVMGADACQAVDKPEFRTYGIIVEKVVKMVTVFLFLSPWGARVLFGEESLVTLYILHDIPAYLAITLVEFGLVHKYCVKVRVNVWQTFVAGSLASVPLVPVNLLLVHLLNVTWIATGGSIVAALGIILGGFLGIFFAFPAVIFFFFALFGGLDSRSIVHFENAARLAGPSKKFVTAFCKAARKGFELSPIKDRFRTPWEDADREAAELDTMQYLKTKEGSDAVDARGNQNGHLYHGGFNV